MSCLDCSFKSRALSWLAVQKGPLDVGDSMPLIVFFTPAVLNYIHIETEIRRLVPSLLTAQHTFTG